MKKKVIIPIAIGIACVAAAGVLASQAMDARSEAGDLRAETRRLEQQARDADTQREKLVAEQDKARDIRNGARTDITELITAASEHVATVNGYLQALDKVTEGVNIEIRGGNADPPIQTRVDDAERQLGEARATADELRKRIEDQKAQP